MDPLQPGRRVFDPEIYDHPVFIHPPVYPALLAASRLMLGSRGGPLLSILVHVATVLAVGLLGRLWFGDKVGVLAAVLVGLEPVTWLAGSHMWTDGLAELNVVLAMLAAALALRSDRTRGFAAAGVVLSVALVTKYPAVLVAPAIYVAFSIAERRPAARDRWVYLAGAASLIVPWLLLFRLGYGAWLPVTKPTPWLMETYAYVKMMAARPWHFYLSGLVCVAPVGLFGIAAIGEVRRQRPVRVLLTWAATAVVVMTALGISGHGMQLRYLGPGIPAICLLASVGIARIRSRTGLAVAGVATVVTFVSSLANARFAEPFPTALVYVAQQLGLPIETWLGGMW